MNTEYDTLMESFLINCPCDDLPTTEEGMYRFIQNGIAIYNVKVGSYKKYLQHDIVGDNDMEQINVCLTDTELLLMAHCIELSHLRSSFNLFSQIYNTFSKEMGLKNHSASVSSRLTSISQCEKVIGEILENSVDDWEV